MISSVISPSSFMYGVKPRRIPTSRYSTVSVITSAVPATLVTCPEVTGICWATSIFDSFPFVEITLGEERIDTFPSSARARTDPSSRSVFSSR